MNQEAVKSITDEEMLDELLSTPRQELVELMKRLEGDITIIGVAGKMGVTLGRMAKRAVDAAGVGKRICGVDVFGDAVATAPVIEIEAMIERLSEIVPKLVTTVMVCAPVSVL